MSILLLVQCPKCGNKMKASPRGNDLSGKKKRCVYCGATFSLRDRIIRQL